MDHDCTLLLQANLNHCAGAQDLFLQSMAQWSIGVAVAAEPYYVPPRPNWVGDWDGSVAVVSSTAPRSPPLSLKDKGSGYVAAEWGGILVFGVYFSPNRSLADFEVFLTSLETSIRRLASGRVLVMGDFNAKSEAWGSPRTDARGRAVEEWASSVGLCLLNRGTTDTCVRQQGGSIVDLSFASPAVAHNVRNWRVLEEVETLSDHRYIRAEISRNPQDPVRGHMADRAPRFPRWAVGRLNRDLLEEAAIVQSWLSPVPPDEGVDAAADRIRVALTQVCDAAMPRVRRRPPRKEVYWWSRELVDLREACIRARRSYTRSRRRRRNDNGEGQLYEAYQAARDALKLAICRAKEQSRQEMLEGLDRDPWGRPYRAALSKLRATGPPLTESLQPSFLTEVVEGLFPPQAEHTPPAMAEEAEVREADEEEVAVPPVTEAEMGAAVLRIRSKRTAPGPDGIPARVLALALDHMGDRLRELFDACLSSRRFPECWKVGRLVLLPKPGRALDSVAAYRPIVLLDEAGKLLERILAARIVRHLEEVGPDLSDAQFGFRAGRSTIDAILALRAATEEAVRGGGVMLAVSLDIANAFNTLPFGSIGEALRFHGVPAYLRLLMADYLERRSVLCEDRAGDVVRRAISRGVPQGSVLGPLLWNIGYDWALRGVLPPGLSVFCYADDTLVAARGRNFEEAARLATTGVSQVVGRIEALGLKVALTKTEALLFHGPRRGPPAGASITVGSVLVPVQAQMRYLGLVLDGRWLFDEHFRQLEPKLDGAASALGRLLPNLGGPSLACRRLYTGVVRSMALYGAPVWAGSLTAQNRARLCRPQRTLAVRAIRGYRTVSADAACALAGTPPWDLEAEVLADVYRRAAEFRAGGGGRPLLEQVREWREAARRAIVARWSVRLEAPRAGFRTVEALRPVLSLWVWRQHGTLSFRLVQVLSGHGCFGYYLHKVARRESSPACHHCDCDEDTAQHTLEFCPAWAQQRRALVETIGADLSLSAIIRSMADSDRNWNAVASFCENVISQKEAAERAREESLLADPIRRRRTGRRRRADARLMPP